MRTLITLTSLCLLLAGQVVAQEVTTRSINGVACQADRRYSHLQSTTQSTMDSYKAQLDAILECQAQKKLWDGSACIDINVDIPDAEVTINTITSPEIFIGRCGIHSNNGSRRNTNACYNVYKCNKQPTRVQITRNIVTITQDTCTGRRQQLIYNGDWRGSPCGADNSCPR
jgi:hypothetical protein